MNKEYIWYVPKSDQFIIRPYKSYKDLTIPCIRAIYKDIFVFIGEF